MARRPEHTVIFAGLHRTDRVDLGPGPEFPVLGQQHLKPLDSDELPIRIESALLATATMPQVGKSVWALWEGAVSQMLDMSAGVVAGLEPHHLADTLSFEAEPLTGVPATDSAIDGVVQHDRSSVAPELQRYWITQIPASIRSKLEETVLRSRARLAGIAHPGGLPRARWEMAAAAATGTSAAPLAGDQGDWGGQWRRIEVWDQVIFSIVGQGDGPVATRLIRAAPGSDWWSAELPAEGSIAWMGPLPATRIGPGGRRLAEGPALLTAEGLAVETVRVDFPGDAAPVEWLRAWVKELVGRPRRVPVIAVPSNVSANRKFHLIGGGAAALALVVCLGHGGWLSFRASVVNLQAQRLEAMRIAPKDLVSSDEQQAIAETTKLQETQRDLEQKEAELTAKLTAARKAADDAAAQTARYAALRAVHRPALPALLAALAGAERDENPGEIVVKDVRQNGSGLRLTGICRQSALADVFATKLEEHLKKSGWKVGAAQKRLRPDQMAFDFVVELAPSVLTDGVGPDSGRSIAPSNLPLDPAREGEVARARTGARRS